MDRFLHRQPVSPVHSRAENRNAFYLRSISRGRRDIRCLTPAEFIALHSDLYNYFLRVYEPKSYDIQNNDRAGVLSERRCIRAPHCRQGFLCGRMRRQSSETPTCFFDLKHPSTLEICGCLRISGICTSIVLVRIVDGTLRWASCHGVASLRL
ncbi:hypothetical protein BOTBODRAFT_496514 [Botryobasidium botryosum FD-172 SS1]|uniref:Uncharacterized protein n=1 Tax=Botryobasidium botryosum (strain FD-172 SS1) TaxID=930990 RepID=A0A067M394_BOTB1|nr:hypothetical protein BOTBODRAFT_496514 [Botryobasidium botryosum FD-172 SS1]